MANSGGKTQTNRVGVFVEGGSLQYWASRKLRRKLRATDIGKIVERFGGNPEEIKYYLEAYYKKDEKTALTLQSEGLHVHVTDLMTEEARAYRPKSEEALERDASAALPNIDHLIIICGKPFQTWQSLFRSANQAGIRIELVPIV